MRASASSWPAGSGCSTSVTPAFAHSARFCSRLSVVQASLASTMSSDSGAACAHRGDARAVAVAAELDLEQRPMRRLGGRRRHRLGRARARSCRRWCRPAGRGARAGPRRAGRWSWPRGRASAQSSALRAAQGGIAACRACLSSPRANGFPHRQERGQRGFRGLAIARIGDAFAAPGMAATADFRHDRHRLGFGAAADGEAAGDRPAFDSARQALGICWKSF